MRNTPESKAASERMMRVVPSNATAAHSGFRPESTEETAPRSTLRNANHSSSAVTRHLIASFRRTGCSRYWTRKRPMHFASALIAT